MNWFFRLSGIFMCWFALGVINLGCSKDHSGNPDSGTSSDTKTTQRFSKAFTTDEDFAQGVLNGVTYETQTNQLQMNQGRKVFETPYIWITNTGDDTITQINTRTREIVAQIPLELDGVKCTNSSRSTVNGDYDVWVACRGSANIAKISHEEKRVVKILPVEPNTIPRGMAIDAQGHLWVGCGDDDNNQDPNDLDLVYKFDESTGECLLGNQQGNRSCQGPPLQVADWPYGAAVDADGYLWMLSNHHWTNGTLTKIDTKTNTIVGTYKRTDGGCAQFYGIAIDQLGYVWTGNHQCNDILKFKSDGTFVGGYLTGGTTTRGVAVDQDGNVWVATSGTHTATKHNGKTGDIIHTVNVGTHPIGVGVDAFGNVWVINYESHDVYLINGVTYEQIIIPLGENKKPYTYSDMLGTAYNNITLRKDNTATWTANYDSGVLHPKWQTISFTIEEPPGTTIKVKARCAPSQAELMQAVWGTPMTASGPLVCAQERWIQIEVQFQSSDLTASPVLKDITVSWEE